MTMKKLKTILLFFQLIILLFSITSVGLGTSYIQKNEEEKLLLNLDVAVIIFDQGELSKAILGKDAIGIRDFSINYTCIEQSITIKYNVSVLDAPKHFVDRLAEWFNNSYLDRGVPDWVADYGFDTQLHPIRWIRLENAILFLYKLSIDVLNYYGLSGYDAIIAIVGDIDGVSRQYFAEGRGGLFTGISGWAMTGPSGLFTFYDLTAAPRPRPEEYQPFYGIGVEVSPKTVQVLWKTENVSERVWTLVRNHLITHLGGFCRNSATLNLNLDIFIVDYNGSSAKILNNFSIDDLSFYLESMAPWVNFDINISIVEDEYLSNISYAAINTEKDGWIILNWNYVSRRLWEFLNCNNRVSIGASHSNNILEDYSYPIVVFATPQPSYFTMEVNRNYRINFTGISTICYSAISYPGYMGRIYRVGLESVIAHEVGHRLGLPHPFESPEGILWEMDWAQTVMTYDDYAPPPFMLPGGVDGYAMWRLALVYTLMALNNINDSSTRHKILSYLEEGEVYRALDISLKHLLKTYNFETTTTIVETETIKETITVTKPSEEIEEKTIEIILLILLILLFTLLLSRG